MSDSTHATDHEMLSDLPSDTGDIEIIPRYNDDISHPNCLIVAPFRKSAHGPTIMATVEHYLWKKDSTGFPWTIIPVAQEPLVLKAAVEAALAYAEDKKVPVIFLNQDGFSTDAERKQTDTTVIKRPMMADGTS
jgi:hypothetical protein